MNHSVWSRLPTTAAERFTVDDVIYVSVVGAVLIVLLVAAWFGLLWLRRRVYDAGRRSAPSPWTLDGLRELRSSGLIDEAEYARLRQSMIDAFGSARKKAAADQAEPAPALSAESAAEPDPSGPTPDENAGTAGPACGPAAPPDGPPDADPEGPAERPDADPPASPP